MGAGTILWSVPTHHQPPPTNRRPRTTDEPTKTNPQGPMTQYDDGIRRKWWQKISAKKRKKGSSSQQCSKSRKTRRWNE